MGEPKKKLIAHIAISINRNRAILDDHNRCGAVVYSDQCLLIELKSASNKNRINIAISYKLDPLKLRDYLRLIYYFFFQIIISLS